MYTLRINNSLSTAYVGGWQKITRENHLALSDCFYPIYCNFYIFICLNFWSLGQATKLSI